jgi:formyl-CoA transferase/CoA:oxalate CoA-transferase
VNSLTDILANPHLQARESLIAVEYPPGSGRRYTIPGMPWRDVAASSAPQGPPTLGQHSAELLGQDQGLRSRQAAK